MRFPIRIVAPTLAAIAVLSPLTRSPHDDTYPLSTFPMFATDRGAVHGLVTAVLVTDGQTVARLTPEEISGTGEPVLAAVTVSRAIRRGDADVLCAEILVRVGVEAIVEVRTETYDVIDYISHDAGPLSVTVHARCGNG